MNFLIKLLLSSLRFKILAIFLYPSPICRSSQMRYFSCCVIVAPPCHVVASCISLAQIFYKNQSSLMPLLLLVRQKARSARLLACKRTHCGSLSLPPFGEYASAMQYLTRSHQLVILTLKGRYIK